MNKRVVIDLTSLLDVILILLFFVLANASGQSANMRAQAQSLSEELARSQARQAALLAERESLQTALSAYGLISERCLVARLYVTGGQERRTLHLDTDAEQKTYPLTWENAGAVRSALRAELDRLTQSGPLACFLVFRYDRNAIYRADYALISGLMSQVKAARDNVYSLEYDSAQEDSYATP